MHADTKQCVAELRQQIQAARGELDESIKRFGGNRDEFLLDRIKRAYFRLDDVENMFLRTLDEDRSPPRSKVEEAGILQGALNEYHNIVLPAINELRQWSVTYGPDFIAMKAK